MSRSKTVLTGILSLGLLVALGASVTSSQPQAQYSIAVIPASQKASAPPLQIISTSMDTGRDLLKEVKVQNISDKTIVKYSLGWSVRNAVPAAEGFQAGTETYGNTVGKPVQVRLLPGMVDKAPPQGLLPADLERDLSEKGAHSKVFVLVGVAQVTFEDGSTWSSDPKQYALAVRRKGSATLLLAAAKVMHAALGR